MRFPGSFVYYLFFGAYLSWLALLGRVARRDDKLRVVERLQWTDLSSYLSWIIRHVGLPASSSVVLESRLLGIVGVVEPTMSEFLRTQHGDIFVDVGAYHGHYSLLLRRNFSRVIALEPVPKNFEFLRGVVGSRRVHNIDIMRLAAAASDGSRQLIVTPQPSESKLLSDNLGDKAITVGTISLSSLLSPFARVDLIKLDVEGAEFEVIEGARHSIETIQSWLIELHDTSRRAQLERCFQPYGYNLRWIDERHLFAWRP